MMSSDEGYELTRARVIDYLEALSNAPEEWRKARAVRVQCRKCNDLAAEIISTPILFSPWVVVHRGFDVPDGPHSLREVGQRSTFEHVSVLLTPNQDPVVIACRCGKHSLRPTAVFGAIRDNRRKLLLDTPEAHA